MKAKTSLVDLNEVLFEQLDRLSNDDLSPEELDKEIKRTDAIVGVSVQVINNASLLLQAAKVKENFLGVDAKLPALLEGKSDG